MSETSLEGDVAKIARSVGLLVRLKVDEIKGDRSQSEMIRVLAELGASAAEISSLLNARRTTVDPIVSRARASGSGTRKKNEAPRRKTRGSKN